MIPALTPSLLLLLALIGCSAFFSGSEAALFSLTDLHLQRMEERKMAAAGALRRLLARPRRVLITVLTGNELVNVSFSAVAAGIGLARGVPAWIVVAAATLAILVLGEITPKTIARRWPGAFSRAVRRPLAAAVALLTPVRWFLENAVLGAEDEEAEAPAAGAEAVRENEFLMLVGLGIEEGVLKDREGRLIESVFEMGDIRAARVMTPRTEVFALPTGTRLGEALRRLRETPYSRVPIYGEDLDDVRGVLHGVDMIRAIALGRSDEPVEALCRRPLYVPLQKKVADLFRELRRRRVHLAFVVDEYGGVAGVVTIDDILRELFGELKDEHDVEEIDRPRREREGVFVVPGWMEVGAFNEFTGASVAAGENATVGGVVFSRTGRLPKAGEIATVDGVSFKVLEMDGTRVARLRADLRTKEEP